MKKRIALLIVFFTIVSISSNQVFAATTTVAQVLNWCKATEKINSSDRSSITEADISNATLCAGFLGGATEGYQSAISWISSGGNDLTKIKTVKFCLDNVSVNNIFSAFKAYVESSKTDLNDSAAQVLPVALAILYPCGKRNDNVEFGH